MNILYVTSSFDKRGSASVRNVSLVNGLIENGANVDVLTQLWPDSMIDKDLKKNINNNVEVYYDSLKVINMYFSRIDKQVNQKKGNQKFATYIKNFIKYIYFFPDIDKEWIKKYNKKLDYSKYDLIISSSDTKTSHIVANEIYKNTSNARWFQIWGDPWVDDKGTRGMRKVLAYFYEKTLLKKADKVFYISLPTLKTLKLKYKKSASKMFHLNRSYLKEVKSNGKEREEFVFSYIGSIYYGRNIMPLIEAINDYNIKYKKQIKLTIYGTYSEAIVNESLEYKFVEFYGFVEYDKVVEVIADSDVLIFMSNMKDSHQIPGKLFDYFGTDISILALVESIDNNVSKFIQQTNRCILFENNKRTIDLDYVVNQILKNNQTVLTEYSKENVAKGLLDHFRKSD
ncbi:glycosyltransferase [Cytobacillus gottheilii]|uniref:glycosyltransferase n=1 Tax=Cytobacillus gottheilii TaxID=859144 RepID=UPI002494A12E|nr:glycosyltransferase [Cytobacillus gottheilii]